MHLENILAKTKDSFYEFDTTNEDYSFGEPYVEVIHIMGICTKVVVAHVDLDNYKLTQRAGRFQSGLIKRLRKKSVLFKPITKILMPLILSSMVKGWEWAYCGIRFEFFLIDRYKEWRKENNVFHSIPVQSPLIKNRNKNEGEKYLLGLLHEYDNPNENTWDTPQVAVMVIDVIFW